MINQATFVQLLVLDLLLLLVDTLPNNTMLKKIRLH